jgi:hypothetical protein
MSSQPTIAATLDLTNENERFIYNRIHGMHTGRWPLWRMLAIRRLDERICELAEHVPRRPRKRRRFAVVHWSINPPGLSWMDYPSLRAARDAFNAIS